MNEIEEKQASKDWWYFIFYVTKKDGKPGEIWITIKTSYVEEFRKDLYQRLEKIGLKVENT